MKADIEADVTKGILEKVPVSKPDSWCSRMVIQERRNARARRTRVLSHLSKHGLDKTHITSSAATIAMRIPGQKLKSTLECVDSYHGIELEEADRHKTTEGYLSLRDSYIKHTDAIIDDCPSTTLDRDFNTVKGAFKRISSILSHSNKNGLVFSFARKEVEFAGFMITENGINPAPKYTASINDFPTPSREVRAWYGLITKLLTVSSKLR